jgi:hypothetical protein
MPVTSGVSGAPAAAVPSASSLAGMDDGELLAIARSPRAGGSGRSIGGAGETGASPQPPTPLPLA